MTPRLVTVGRRVIPTPGPDRVKGRKQLWKQGREGCEERALWSCALSLTETTVPGDPWEGARRINILILLSSLTLSSAGASHSLIQQEREGKGASPYINTTSDLGPHPLETPEFPAQCGPALVLMSRFPQILGAGLQPGRPPGAQGSGKWWRDVGGQWGCPAHHPSCSREQTLRGCLDSAVRGFRKEVISGLCLTAQHPPSPLPRWCFKRQLVDLVMEGVWQELLDSAQIEICVADW